MNKYQESLDFIVKNSCPTHNSCRECNISSICNNLVKIHIDCLQELIDKSLKKYAIKHEDLEDGALYYDIEDRPCRYYQNIDKMKFKNDELKDFTENSYFSKKVEL